MQKRAGKNSNEIFPKNDHLPQHELAEDHFPMDKRKEREIVNICGYTITLDHVFFIETYFSYAQSSSR